MSRNLEPVFGAVATSTAWRPCMLAQITFRTGVQYIWTGVGGLVFGGNTYIGVGNLGAVGPISEGVDVESKGTTISLSGIDPTLLGDALLEIQVGAPATLLLGALDVTGALIGTPYPIYAGTVDKASVSVGAETVTITLSLENRLTNLQRPTARRYTSADQKRRYPTDSGFNWVEILNDIALRWGN